MLVTVLVPMARGGRTRSTPKSRAARAVSASAAVAMPGAMAPPRNSPRAETHSNVVAVPRSTMMSGAPYSSRPATILTIRVVHPHRNRHVDPGLHHDRSHPEGVPYRLLESALHCRHRRRDGHGGDDGGSQADPGQEGLEQGAVLVGGLLASAGDAPGANETGTVVEPELRVGVPDVDGQQHRRRPQARVPAAVTATSEPSRRRMRRAPLVSRSTAVPSSPVRARTGTPRSPRARQAARTASNPVARSAS